MSSEQLGGPYVQVAALCETVIESKDGVLSLIRVIDRYIHTVAGPAPPERLEAFSVSPVLVIMLKAGFMRGSYQVRIRAKTPSQQSLPDVSVPMLFEADHRGANVVLRMQLQIDEEGIYWFEILGGETLLTKVPLQIVYQRLALAGPAAPPGAGPGPGTPPGV